MNWFWNQLIVLGWLCVLLLVVAVVSQVSGGQHPQVGSRARLGGVKSEPSNSKGRRIGFRRSWKAFGKKATTKIPRKIRVFRRLVSNGIEILNAVTSGLMCVLNLKVG